MKQVLMIHDINYKMFSLPLAEYELTFDDGYKSHFDYWSILKKIDTPKVFFISGSYVDSGDPKYMTLDNIRQIRDEGGIIGGHGYAHIKDYNGSASENMKKFTDDLEMMYKWFADNGLDKPTHFAFPYNKEMFVMRGILRQTGIEYIYSGERTPVENLIK